MPDHPPTPDITRITLAVVAIAGMTAASLWVMLPFIAAIVWAAMIVIATWPVLGWLQARFGGRRGPAIAILVVALLALIVLPVWLVVSAIAGNADQLAQLARRVVEQGLPPPPAWIDRIPLAGHKLDEAWRSVAGDPSSIAARVAPHLGEATRWLASRAGNLGAAVVQFLLTVAIAAILYATGEKAGMGVRRFLRRLAGDRGENAAQLAAKAVRAVALGIVVTALIQTTLAGIGLGLGGVPRAGVLTAVAFVLCIAQLGPLLVTVPAVIWLYSTGEAGRGTILLVFTLLSATLDNIVRPWLIKKGANLPLLLIVAGVIGGLIGFGVVGLFVGPVILAVTWTLVASWVADLDRGAAGGRAA